MDNESCESSDTVTLVLRDCRVKASKQKLAHSSRYFASLFSEKFKDHKQKEFAINYEISLGSLQDFVDWVDNEGNLSNSVDSTKYNLTVKKPLQKFLTGNRLELLELLNVGDIFMAEKLMEDITDMIIYMRLPPDEMLELWLLFENLGFKALECVALATCLDRFDELTEASLVKLSSEHLSKLLCNVNVRSSPERLMNIREAWIQHNGLIADMPDSSLRFIKGEPEDVITVLKKAKPHYVQCVRGHKLNEAKVIFCWNGETLQELAEIGKEIIAGRIVGRGFSIYAVGRKKGENVDNCNSTIWRYCVFTKKWYIETMLPRRLRNMNVCFLKRKLYVFGGIGPTEQQDATVDVYDVHTGLWSTAADIPDKDQRIDPHSSCVADGKLVVRRHDRLNNIYDPLTDTWEIVRGPSVRCGHSLDFDKKKDLIGAFKSSSIKVPVLYTSRSLDKEQLPYLHHREGLQTEPKLTMRMTALDHKNYDQNLAIHSWLSPIIDQQVMNGPQIVSFGYSDGRVCVEVGEVNQYLKKQTEKIGSSYRSLKIYSQDLHDVPENCFQLDLGCFNLIEPESILTTIAMPEDINIGEEFTTVQQRKLTMKNHEKLKTLKK